MDHFAGLDVSVKVTSICIVDDTGKIVREVKVASEPEALLSVLKNPAYHIKRIGLEAGPLSQWLFGALAEAELPVVCVETRHMQAVLKAQINKTDRNDARGIAQMMRVGLYRPVHVKTLRSQKLRMLLTHRKLLQSKAIAIENDLRGTLRNFGLKVGMVGTVKFEARIKELGCGPCRLASARQIARLLTDGVRLSEIVRGVSEIRKWLPEVGLSNVRFRAGPHNSLEIEQPQGRTDKRGQFLFAVDGSEQSPDDLFDKTQSAEAMGDIAEAERLYRLLMKSDPAEASAPFNLGNMLRVKGRYVEAEAAFRTATRVDPEYAQAWYNLGDLLDDQGRADAAIECLRKALRVAPDYADAMFNLALLLQRKNQYTEAAEYWRRYLTSDCQSEWATRARRSLKFCEMQGYLMASAR